MKALNARINTSQKNQKTSHYMKLLCTPLILLSFLGCYNELENVENTDNCFKNCQTSAEGDILGAQYFHFGSSHHNIDPNTMVEVMDENNQVTLVPKPTRRQNRPHTTIPTSKEIGIDNPNYIIAPNITHILSEQEKANITKTVDDIYDPAIEIIFKVGLKNAILDEADFNDPHIVQAFQSLIQLYAQLASDHRYITHGKFASLLGSANQLIYYASKVSQFHHMFENSELYASMIKIVKAEETYKDYSQQLSYTSVQTLRTLGHVVIHGADKGLSEKHRSNILSLYTNILRENSTFYQEAGTENKIEAVRDAFFAAIWTLERYNPQMTIDLTGRSYTEWTHEKKQNMFPTPLGVDHKLQYLFYCTNNTSSFCNRYIGHIPNFIANFKSLRGFNKLTENAHSLSSQIKIYIFNSGYDYYTYSCIFEPNLCTSFYEKSGDIPPSGGSYYWKQKTLITYNRPNDQKTDITDSVFFHEFMHLLEGAYLAPNLVFTSAVTYYFSNLTWLMEGLADYGVADYFAQLQAKNNPNLFQQIISNIFGLRYLAYVRNKTPYFKSLHELLWLNSTSSDHSFGFKDYVLSATFLDLLHNQYTHAGSSCIQHQNTAYTDDSWTTVFSHIMSDQIVATQALRNKAGNQHPESSFLKVLSCIKDDPGLNNQYDTNLRNYPIDRNQI